MQCRHCGSQLAEGVAFCQECGTPVPPPPSSLSPTVAAPQPPYGAPTPYTNYNPSSTPGSGQGYETAPNPYANAPYNPYGQPPQPGNVPPYGQPPQPGNVPPYGQIPPVSSYTPPPQPNNLPAYGAPQPGNIPYGPPFVAQPVKPRGKAGLITGIVIAIVAIILVGGVILATSTKSSHNTAITGNTVGLTPTATPSGPTTPSGQPIDSTASSVVTNIQMASAIDTTLAQPTTPTTSFKTYSDIYSTFQFNFNNTNISAQNPGYVEAKYYIANSRILTAEPLKIDDTAIPGGYFKVQYYHATTAGAVELYWCRQSTCSDEKLAGVGTFTVS